LKCFVEFIDQWNTGRHLELRYCPVLDIAQEFYQASQAVAVSNDKHSFAATRSRFDRPCQ